MRPPASLPFCLACLALPMAVLVSPPAYGHSLDEAHEGPLEARARGVPAAIHLLPAEAGAEAPGANPPGRRIEANAPVTSAAWVTYGAFALVPLGGIYGASRLGGERLWVTALEAVTGSVVGGVPGGLLFLQSADAGGRWAELDVVAFGAGLLLTPPIAALGTWGLGELAFDGSKDSGDAFLGALGGAAVGTLLGVVVHAVMEEVVGNTESLARVRKYIALGFIGSGATVGYQWAGGGPR